jgi:hypothetical protein
MTTKERSSFPKTETSCFLDRCRAESARKVRSHITGFRGLQGRRTLITCAASGIGRATAIRLAKEGAIVGILDLDGDGDGAEETAGMLRSAGAEESAEGGAALKEKRDPDFRRFK